jgi:hypothetical protein
MCDRPDRESGHGARSACRSRNASISIVFLRRGRRCLTVSLLLLPQQLHQTRTEDDLSALAEQRSGILRPFDDRHNPSPSSILGCKCSSFQYVVDVGPNQVLSREDLAELSGHFAVAEELLDQETGSEHLGIAYVYRGANASAHALRAEPVQSPLAFVLAYIAFRARSEGAR